MGRADRILELYGLRQFLEDIDRGREFWRDGGGIVGATLEWLSGEGFAEFMRRADLEYFSAHEYRNRFLISLLRGLGGG